MTKQDKTLADSIPAELNHVLVEVVAPIAPPETRASELKLRVMARIRGKQSFDMLTVKVTDGQWIALLPGVEKKILNEDAEGRVQSFLLRMAPGSTLPAHEHDADEEAIMLDGDVMIGDIALTAGDYHFAPKGSKHGVVTTQAGCLVFLRIS
jgi:quercetin dioxygenase-like cupin family protein